MAERREGVKASAVSVRPGEGTIVRGPVGGPLTFKVRGEQSDGRLEADPREAFRSIGAEVGMDVIGPPLAQSHPTLAEK